jgi:hypothetical protein
METAMRKLAVLVPDAACDGRARRMDAAGPGNIPSVCAIPPGLYNMGVPISEPPQCGLQQGHDSPPRSARV